MTDSEWFKLFDETKDKFKWFFIANGFEVEWDAIMIWREVEIKQYMIQLMNKVWFELPDNNFNIKVNPPGWMEFLNLIEE